ncbi:ATP12 family protein [Altererythrobacter sp. TH136]|uniref:ATP12 family chaperone protein n=1 Tax=Altererythrobacter sp. TH136 TaxID=2067415 RepID=UPI001164F3B3|nr:ATP12 family protein [Altererythrobacter sp. TH136]QDM41567.1 molecular chaperone [Altererythrobacter sp. TH136]
MKRFWKGVSVEPESGGWQVTLDGRRVRTQGGAAQVVPSRALAELLADEWRAQGEEIDPAAFRARDLADYAVDVVTLDPAQVVAKILRYAETDTLCYRADPDEPLHRRQWAEWEPVIAALEAREGVTLERVSGIVHRRQPAATLARLQQRLESLDPFTLAALEVLASLSASLTVALSALEPDADPAALWAAAELEETWQVELWGSDALAEERRQRRADDFHHAVQFARAAAHP